MNLQRQLAALRRGPRRSVKVSGRGNRASTTAVTAAKDWLAAHGRSR